MTITVSGDICTKALQLLGVADSTGVTSAADINLALDMLNAMMDSWSNESLTCYEVLEQSALLVVGQSSYTIGPGGNFNMQRPLKILEDPGTAYVQDANGNNYPVDVVPRDKWNLYSNRSNLINSNFPNVLFYDPQFPLGVINIIPFPNIAYTLFWDSYLQLADYSTLTQAIDLPPGYAMAMIYNLAIILKPFFLDSQLAPEIVVKASDALAAIKRTNIRPTEALYDSEIVSHGQISYNVYTDSAGSVVPVS